MAQQLRVLASLKNLGPIASLLLSVTLVLAFMGTRYIHGAQKYMQANTHTCKIKKFKRSN